MSLTMSEDNLFPRVEGDIKKWVVVVSAALFFFYELIQIHLFGAINEPISRDLAISSTQLGFLSSLSLWSNVLFLFPAGIILDRFSTKKVVLLTMAICVIGTFLFGQSQSFEVACFARFLTGIGSAFCFLSCIRLASHWFPANQMALATGVIVTIAMCGGVFAQTPMIWLTAEFGWRQALMIDGVLGIFVIGVIALLVRDYPKTNASHLEAHHDYLKGIGYFAAFKMAFSRAQNYFAAFYTCMLNIPLMVIGGLWGIRFLTYKFGLSDHEASIVTTMLYVGILLGGPVVGYVSDRIGLRRMPMLIGAIISIVMLFIILNLSIASYGLLVFLFLLLGLATSFQVLGYPTVAESNQPAITATAVSIVSITTQGGAAFGQNLFSYLLERNWDGVVVDGIRQYASSDYSLALSIFPVAFFTALFAAYFLKETHCQGVKPE